MTNHTSAMEADLEARISATLHRVFPGSVDLQHQRRFRVKLGRKTLDVDGRDYGDGRADILVQQGDKPLAILELKREGLALTNDDTDQGASYALLARAPLLVITNGPETRILQTHDLSPLPGTSVDAAELERRLTTAALLAQTSVQGALRRLLGTDLSTQAIAAVTAAELEDHTGTWTSLRRFVPAFLVPREATAAIHTVLAAAAPRAVVVSGPPLCGKSSVLRELATTADAEGREVLYLDGASCADGLFRRLANVLSHQFGWNASTDDARAWLRQVGSDPTRPLVLCLDSLPAASSTLRAELDEILADGLGPDVRLVLAVDEAEVEGLLSSGRELSRLGRQSELVLVQHYNDAEFDAASEQLLALGGGFVPGAQHAPELRAPWVLRAAVAPRMEDLPGGKVVMLPPLLGVETFTIADERFAVLGELRHEFKTMARVYVDQISAQRPPAAALWSLFTYSVSRERLRQVMDREDIQDMVKAGLIRAQADVSGEPSYRIRVPALFAHEVAARLAYLAGRKLEKDAEDAAKWLARTCARIPFGDVIGAAVLQRCLRDVGPGEAIALANGLLQLPPVREPLAPGTKMVGFLPSVGLATFEVQAEGVLVVKAHNRQVPIGTIPLDEEDLMAVADIDGWLILSQVDFSGLVFTDENGQVWNTAAWLLMTLGPCPEILQRPSGLLEEREYHTVHGVDLSCLEQGIAEPLAWTIAEFLREPRPGVERDDWIARAVAQASLPFLNRLTQALSHLSKIEGTSDWADTQLNQVCLPALAAKLGVSDTDPVPAVPVD